MRRMVPMPIASAVVEIKNGTSGTVLGRLARVPQVSVYGVKENQIVTVIEGATIGEIDAAVKEVTAFEDVIGVFPVFIGDHA